MRSSQKTSKLMKALLFSVFSLACQTVFSATLSEQLTEKFKSRVSVLDREMVVFRYESTVNPDLKTADDVQNRIQGWAERFFNKTVITYDIAGPGTYLAIDPFGSRSFGGKDPHLYVLSLKRGTVLLNLDASLKTAEKDLIKKIHNELQCKTKEGDKENLIEEANMNFFSLRKSSTEACREAAIQVAQALNIQGIIYSYMASNNLSGCRQREAAINLVSSAAIDFNTSLYYTNQTAIESTDAGKFIKKFYDESDKDFSLLLSFDDMGPMPAELEKKDPASDAEYALWKKNKIYNCGPKWSSEAKLSSIGSILMHNLKLNYSDKEIETLLLSLRTAYKAKAGTNSYFDIQSVPAFEKLNFKVSGQPQDEAHFKHWLFLTKHSYDKEYKEEIKKMYGIPTTLDDIKDLEPEAEKLIGQLTPQQRKQPGLYVNLLEHFKITGPFVLVMLNEMNMPKGRIILSSVDPKKSFAENLSVSKQAYKVVLSECLRMYSDPSLTNEEIQKTDCAVVRAN